jgi:DNA-binding LacI/PurR family transcriptional regulator
VADYQPERVQMAMERLLLNHPDVDAVFAASDLIATAAMQVLLQARKRIPEDVAIIDFDDSSSCLVIRPPLSSIRQPIEAMSREAVKILMRTIAEPGEAPRQVMLATELVARESTVGASHNRAQR